MKRIVVHLALMVGVLALAGCAPALNWRQVAVGAHGAQAFLPCKPEQATREVAVDPPPAPPRVLHMLACEAGGARFAVAWMAVTEPQNVAALAQHWRRASGLGVGVTPASMQAQPWVVRHARWSQRWRGTGQYQGEPMPAAWGWAGTDTELIQLAIYGPLKPLAQETFWDGLNLPPAR